MLVCSGHKHIFSQVDLPLAFCTPPADRAERYVAFLLPSIICLLLTSQFKSQQTLTDANFLASVPSLLVMLVAQFMAPLGLQAALQHVRHFHAQVLYLFIQMFFCGPEKLLPLPAESR